MTLGIDEVPDPNAIVVIGVPPTEEEVEGNLDETDRVWTRIRGGS